MGSCAAQICGQEDDIGAIALTRTAVLELALPQTPYKYLTKCRQKYAACLAAIGLSRR
jgi:hypothetical protein